jgi:hypothetical protein
MPLNAGNLGATQGLARDIFDVLDAQLAPPLAADLEAEQLEEIRDAWRTLSFCVASGVIEHLMRVPATEPEYAEAFTSSAQDAQFWNWFSGFTSVFRTWSSGAGTLTDLRTSLNNFFNANTTPTQLRGIVR